MSDAQGAGKRKTESSAPRRTALSTSPLAAAAMICCTQGISPALAIDPALVEAARKEGRVVWLTTQIMGELALPLAAAFKSTYGIDVSVSRAGPRQMVERVTQADRTGQGTGQGPAPQSPASSAIDVVDGRGVIAQMKRADLLASLDIENAKRLPAELVDRQGMWFATNVFTISIAVNTDLVAADQRPRTLDDLLRPEWSGRMAWSQQSTQSAGAGFIGAVMRDRGEVHGRLYLAHLARQKIAGFDVTSRQIIEKVIAGEFPIALQVYSHQAAAGAGRNAPVAWLPIAPVTGNFAAVAATRRAAHPNAARLFIEFQLSRQGQEIFRDADQLPAAPDVPPNDPSLMPAGGNFRALFFAAEEVEAQMPAWNAIRESLFP